MIDEVTDSYMYIIESYYEVMDNNVLKFIFLYSNDSGQGLGAYDSYCLLICFPIELMNTIFSSNMQPAMYVL